MLSPISATNAVDEDDDENTAEEDEGVAGNWKRQCLGDPACHADDVVADGFVVSVVVVVVVVVV